MAEQTDGFRVPDSMRAWVLGDPHELVFTEKPVPAPGHAEVLVRIDAIAVCATDLEVIAHGPPALIEGGLPFNKNFIPGHEYMGTIVRLGPDVDEFAIGERVAVEIHAGCGRCKRCRAGMYTACHNYGMNYGDRDKGHRANGYTTDGGFAEYAVNNVNTLVRVPDGVDDAEATLIVTAGTAVYGLDVLGGLIAGESLVVTGGGPIGLMAINVAKALGAAPIVLSDIEDNRLEIGRRLGADIALNPRAVNVVERVREISGGPGCDYVMECSGAPSALSDAMSMVSRGGRVCLAAFASQPVTFDAARLVMENIYLFGIRGEGRSAVRRAAALLGQGRIAPSLLHTHTFPLDEVPTAIRYAREKIDGAIKVVVGIREA
ncbi:MAG: zinc-binding dehydrogenase [Rhodospirillales bacterium]|nr:MAG: zinc-binding dehydrogenase [Rhodospirillales bacterium]